MKVRKVASEGPGEEVLSSARAPLLHGARVALIQHTGLFGKELLALGKSAAGVAVAFVVTIAALEFINNFVMTPGKSWVPTSVYAITTGFLYATAFIVGLGALAYEEENGTRLFLIRLPHYIKKFYAMKFLAAVAVVVLWALFALIFFAVFYRSIPVPATEGWLTHRVVTLLAVGVTAACVGSYVRFNATVAAGIGAVVVVLSWFFGMMLASGCVHGLGRYERGFIELNDSRYLMSTLVGVGMVTVYGAALWRKLGQLDQAIVERARRPRVRGNILNPFFSGPREYRAALPKYYRAYVCVLPLIACVAALAFPSFIGLSGMQESMGWFVEIAGLSRSAARYDTLEGTMLARMVTFTPLVLVLLISGVLTSFGAERKQVAFLPDGLPVSEKSFVEIKFGQLVRCGVLVWSGYVVAVLGAMIASNEGGAETMIALFAQLPFLFGILATAYLFHLFFRSSVLTFVIGATVAMLWLFLQSQMEYFTFLNSTGLIPTIVDLFWPGVLITVVSGLMIYVAQWKSTLRETNEGPRTAAGLVLWLFMLIWPSVLMLVMPSDVWTIIFG